jgi:hypothetical protein
MLMAGGKLIHIASEQQSNVTQRSSIKEEKAGK